MSERVNKMPLIGAKACLPEGDIAVRITVFACTVLLGLVGTAVFAGAAQPAKKFKPIQLHPDNPHYFLWRGRPTVLITSGEHYGAVLNRDFNYKKYLKTLQSYSFNLTRTFSGAYC